MVLMEFSITPMDKGESVSQYVARCVDIIDRSGLEYELHSMGTIVEGELEAVLAVQLPVSANPGFIQGLIVEYTKYLTMLYFSSFSFLSSTIAS